MLLLAVTNVAGAALGDLPAPDTATAPGTAPRDFAPRSLLLRGVTPANARDDERNHQNLPELSSAAPLSTPQPHASRARLTGLSNFQTRSLAVADGLTLADPDGDTLGASWQPLQWERADGGTAIEASYLFRNHTADPDELALDAENRVWGVSGHSSWLDGRFSMHAEYAAGRRALAGESAVDGRAYALSTRYAAPSRQLLRKPLNWDITVQRNAVQSGFWSPVVTSVVPGHIRDQAAMHLAWGRFDATLSRQRLADVPADGTTLFPEIAHRTALDLRYDPESLPAPRFLAGLLKGAAGGLTVSNESIGYANDVDWGGRRIGMTRAYARFHPGDWWWEVSHTRTAAEYEAATAIDQWEGHTQLRLDFPVTERLHVTPSLNWVDLELSDDRDGHRFGSILQTRLTVIPGRMASAFRVETHRERNAWSGRCSRRVRSEGSLNWTVVTEAQFRPSVVISLRGVYERATRPAYGADRYQAHASLEIRWPDAP